MLLALYEVPNLIPTLPPMKTKSHQKEDVAEVLESIDFAVKEYRGGTNIAYRTVATELHNLVCSKQPLLKTVVDNPTLHPLSNQSPRGGKLPDLSSLPQAGNIVMRIPQQVRLRRESGSASIEDLFDTSANPIALQEWLLQDLVVLPTKRNGRRSTIKDLIIQVRSNETSHVSTKKDPVVEGAKQVKLGNTSYLSEIIVSMGEYVAQRTRQLTE